MSKNRYHGAFKLLPIPDKKWVHISIDFIINFLVSRDFWGKNCINIMVIINRLNKIVKCIFMDEIIIKNSARDFHIHVWKNHDLFNFIISNRGRPFVNHFWQHLIAKIEISTDFSTVCHPKTDGQTEIMNSVLEQYFRIYMNYFQNDWAFWLPSTGFIINN